MRIVVDVLRVLRVRCVRIVFGMRSVIGGTVTRRRNHRRYGLIGWQRAVIVYVCHIRLGCIATLYRAAA